MARAIDRPAFRAALSLMSSLTMAIGTGIMSAAAASGLPSANTPLLHLRPKPAATVWP